MNPNIPFQITDWKKIKIEEQKGETGTVYSQTMQFGDLRIRMIEYSKNYMADHWCSKGHIIYCIEGEMTTELSDGSKFSMTEGMTYQVSDEMSSHRTYSDKGVKMFVVDGGFLKIRNNLET